MTSIHDSQCFAIQEGRLPSMPCSGELSVIEMDIVPGVAPNRY